MKTIETTATIHPDGTLWIPFVDLAAGKRQVVLVVDEEATLPPTDPQRDPLILPRHDGGEWLNTHALSRENIYDEWGR